MNKDTIKFMKKAIRISVANVEKQTGGPFGAVVVKDGKIIARGSNQVTASNDPTAHAEVVAIRKACKALKTFQLTGCEIYTSCEPCPMCLGAIYWQGPINYIMPTAKKMLQLFSLTISLFTKKLQDPSRKENFLRNRY